MGRLVRMYEPHDKSHLRKLLLSFEREEAYGGTIPRCVLGDVQSGIDYELREIERGSSMWGFVVGSNPLFGFSILHAYANNPDEGRRRGDIEVESIFVDPKQRGNHYASELLDRSIQQAHDLRDNHDLRRIVYATNATNRRSISLVRSRGFRPLKPYYANGSEYAFFAKRL